MILGDMVEIDVWRKTVPSGVGNWGDNLPDTYEYDHTFEGTVQVFEANEGNRNNQVFSNVRHLVTCSTDVDLIDSDELVFHNREDRYARVVYIEPFENSIRPHLEVFVSDTQWDRA
jgi:hypothetical protein